MSSAVASPHTSTNNGTGAKESSDFSFIKQDQDQTVALEHIYKVLGNPGKFVIIQYCLYCVLMSSVCFSIVVFIFIFIGKTWYAHTHTKTVWFSPVGGCYRANQTLARI